MVAPVANTITSTTSATQDLEVFKNYPSEKNNKLIQQKYGSQDEFFKKVQEEGYKEGFESVEKPSFDQNLPMTEIGEDTFKKFTDPSGLSAYKGTELEKYAGTQDLTKPIPTLQSEFSGQEVPYSQVKEFLDKKRSGEISGITELGKLWNKAGGEFTTPTSYPSMSMEEDKLRQAKEAELYGINAIGQSTGAPAYPKISDKTDLISAPESPISDREDLISAPKKIGEDKTSIYNKRLNDGMMYSDGEMRKQGFSDDQIKRANQMNYSDRSVEFKEEPDNKQRRQEQSQLYGINAIGKSSGAPQDTMGIKSIETKDEEFDAAIDEIKNSPAAEYLKKLASKIGKTVDSVFKSTADNYAQDKRRLGKVKMDSNIWIPLLEEDSGGNMSQWGLPFVNEEGKMFFFDSDKEVKIFGKNITVDKRVKELLAREKVMKDAEEEAKNEPFHVKRNAPLDALDDYIAKQEEGKYTKKDGTEVTVDIEVPKIGETGSGRATDTGGLLEVQRRKMDQLMKQAETDGLPEGAVSSMKSEMKGQGIDTKGLTDKNLLLIAMGLGMMASQKPGLSGVGEGALTGLKTVAPLLTKKASDFQIVEVADKDNPGQTKLVKINKKTNEVTDLGVGGKSKKTEKQKGYEWMSTVTGKPVKNLVMRDLELKDKKKSKRERIEAMAKYVWGQDILGGTQADVAGYIEQATKMIEAIDKIPNADLDDILGL